MLDGLQYADLRLGAAFKQPGMLAKLAALDHDAIPVLCTLALARLNGRHFLTPPRHDVWCIPLALQPAMVECLRCV